MKAFLFLISALLTAQSSYANQMSCEDQIRSEMSETIGNSKIRRSVSLVTDFEGYALYSVFVGSNYVDGMVGIPYSAVYKVLVKKDAQDACSILDMVLESDAQ